MSREMKNSGISWIGDIPKDWNLHRFKYAGTLQKGKLPTETNVDGNGQPIIGASEMLGKPFRQFSMDEGLPECNANDILILWDGANAGIVASGLCGIVSSTTAKYSCVDSRCNPQYTFYLLKGVESYFRDKVFGTTIPHMNSDYIDDIPLLLPSLPEQQKIASFLDRKCSEIDEMIALQEKIVEELKAYKQSVITEAVTKGLNPDAPMKDSGIEWIGEIPEHWEVTKFYRICSVITDFVASGSFENLRINVPYLDYPDYAMLVRTVDLSGKGRTAEKVYISKHSYDFLRNSNLFGGEIILPNIGASVGDVYIVPNLYERMSLAPNSIMFKTMQCDRYWYYYFYSEAGKQSIFDICQSTAQPKFNKTELRNIRVCIPPQNEQQAIADYLNEKCADIDSLIQTKQSKIDSLKEYKKSIIYEYVTGKKEVE